MDVCQSYHFGRQEKDEYLQHYHNINFHSNGMHVMRPLREHVLTYLKKGVRALHEKEHLCHQHYETKQETD